MAQRRNPYRGFPERKTIERYLQAHPGEYTTKKVMQLFPTVTRTNAFHVLYENCLTNNKMVGRERVFTIGARENES